MKKLFGVAQLEEARSCASSIKKHDELKAFGRFWYQKIRDFLIRRHTVVRSVGAYGVCSLVFCVAKRSGAFPWNMQAGLGLMDKKAEVIAAANGI